MILRVHGLCIYALLQAYSRSSYAYVIYTYAYSLTHRGVTATGDLASHKSIFKKKFKQYKRFIQTTNITVYTKSCDKYNI